jgi:hypothetical protein
MHDLFAQDIGVPGVTREVLAQEQVDEPQADVTEVAVCSDVVEVEVCGDHAGTRGGALEFGYHIGQLLVVADHWPSMARPVDLLAQPAVTVLRLPPRLQGPSSLRRPVDQRVSSAWSRRDTIGRAYYQRKRAAGKGHREALRCLERQLADIVYQAMPRDTGTSLLIEA